MTDMRFTDLLKRIAAEEADDRYQDRDKKQSNLEVLARRVFEEALSKNMGSQRARELIVERLEGKAVRGQAPQAPNTTLAEQLDYAERELLNSLSGQKEDEHAVSEREDGAGPDHEHGD